MRQLKPVIQDAADRINDPMIDDDVQAIKDIVVIERKVKEGNSSTQSTRRRANNST